LSHGILGPTEIRIVLMIGNAVLTIHPYAHIGARTFRLFDVGGAVAIAGMAIMAAAATARHTVALYRDETLP
jgi:archaetidylinositol phosphate synthase